MVTVKNIQQDYGAVSVEDFALAYYSQQGFRGIRSENEYWWTIMSLLFWNCIFARVESAVNRSDYTSRNYIYLDDPQFDKRFKETIAINGMPFDFFTKHFFVNRNDLIINRYKELQQLSLAEEIKRSYQSNYRKNCRSIENWDRYSLQDLMTPLSSISSEVVLRICLELLRDFTNNRSGLPDLFLYNTTSCLFVEVKSANDRISDKQISWSKFLSLNLNQNVEILLVNQTDRKAQSVQTKFKDLNRQVTISFGHSSSPKLSEVIDWFKIQPSYKNYGEGKTIRHEIVLDFYDTKNVLQALDLTTRWKSLEVIVDGEKTSSTVVRNSLSCYRENTDLWNIEEMRYPYDYSYGCRNITTPMSSNYWKGYGYVSTNTGEWIFDKEKIATDLTLQISNNRYCPYLDRSTIEKEIKKIPERINPQIDTDWAFVDHSGREWFFKKNAWQSFYSDESFPGIHQLISVKHISGDRRYQLREVGNSDRDSIVYISTKPAKSNSGCILFILWSIRIFLFMSTCGISVVVELAFRYWLRERKKARK